MVDEGRRDATVAILAASLGVSSKARAVEKLAKNGTTMITDEARHDAAMTIISRMLSPEIVAMIEQPRDPNVFGSELGDLSMTAVFEQLWTRNQLDLRTRSLVTVAILVALRATGELSIHVPAAVRNGATVSEIEEVIYQAAGYAGFPAAATARGVAEEALRRAAMIA